MLRGPSRPVHGRHTGRTAKRDATHRVRPCRWWSYRSGEEPPVDIAGNPIPDVSALRADSFDWGLRIVNFGLECPGRIRILFLLSVTKDSALRKWVDYHGWWGLSLWRSHSHASRYAKMSPPLALRPENPLLPDSFLPSNSLAILRSRRSSSRYPSRKARPHTFQPIFRNRCRPIIFIPSLTGLRYNSSVKDKKGIGDIPESFFYCAGVHRPPFHQDRQGPMY